MIGNREVTQSSEVKKSLEVLNLLYDKINELREKPHTLRTLQDLKNEHGVTLGRNIYWAQQAIRHVQYVNVMRANNDLKGNRYTGNWATEMCKIMDDKLHVWLETSKLSTLAEAVIEMAELLATHRGGGDCRYQSCSAFIYLLRNERFCSADINVEYFKIAVDNGHHFLALTVILVSL